MSKVACGWDYYVDRVENCIIYGIILIPILDSVFKYPMNWNIETGLPTDVDKYPTRYYMRLVKK